MLERDDGIPRKPQGEPYNVELCNKVSTDEKYQKKDKHGAR